MIFGGKPLLLQGGSVTGDLLDAWGRGPRGAQGGNLCGVGGILDARGSDGISGALQSVTSIMSVFAKFTV
jgi:hypothetical protein